MRKLPNRRKKEEKFIEEASYNTSEKENPKTDIHQYVKREKWPIQEEELAPSFAEGSNLRKPLTLPLKEFEWNSIDRHTKTLGIQKSEWIRYAAFKLMQEEQLHFLKNAINYDES